MEITDVHIAYLKVSNYKSLKDCEISFHNGLNIIIGKNGAGKSNLLDFLYRNVYRVLVGRMSRIQTQSFSVSFKYFRDEEDSEVGYTAVRNRNDQQVMAGSFMFTYEISIYKQLENEIVYRKTLIPLSSFKRTRGGKFPIDVEYYNEIRTIGLTNQEYISFQLPDILRWVDTPTRIIIDEDNDVSYDKEDFANMTFFVHLEFKISDELYSINPRTKNSVALLKKRFSKLLDSYIKDSRANDFLRKYTPIEEIRFSENINIFKTEDNVIIENVYVEFLVDGDWIPWSYLSDGTKRLFYLVLETISTESGTVFIEEPEVGVHPHQLYKILDFLQEQAKKKQIIISTHSPLSLDVLKEDELDRIILAKNDDGSKFRHLTESEKTKAKRYMNEVGDLSYFWLHSDLEK